MTNCAISVGQKGSFNKMGEWESAGTVTLQENKTLNMEAGLVYRIRMVTIESLPSASTLSTDGYKSTIDSIRS